MQCAADEVVLVDQARYGRMKLNRCARTDYGYVGCAADVTRVLAAKCSGRRHCRIANLEALFSSFRNCPLDLKSYVEADYHCLKGPPKVETCILSKHLYCSFHCCVLTALKKYVCFAFR